MTSAVVLKPDVYLFS